MKRLHPSNRTSSPEEDDDRRRERLVARLVRAATAVDTPDAVALAEEALPFDNEALALAEGCNLAVGTTEDRRES